MKLKKSDIPRELLAAFPDYTGRKFRLEPATRITFYDTHWGGGTRNSYRLVPLTIGAKPTQLAIGSPWNSPTEGATVDILPGFAVIEHSIFCGKDLGLTIHAHPDSIARILAN